MVRLRRLDAPYDYWSMAIQMKDQELDGIWSYTAFTEGPHQRTQEELAGMPRRAFLIGDYLPGWDGLWAIVTYGYQGGSWSGQEVLALCRHKILGGNHVVPPRPDLYLYAGGIFRMTLQRSPHEIDMEHFYDGAGMGFPAESRGIFSFSGDRLILTLAKENHPRPLTFTCGEDTSMTLGELARCNIDEP